MLLKPTGRESAATTLRGGQCLEEISSRGQASIRAGFSTRSPWTALEAKPCRNPSSKLGVSHRSHLVAVPSAQREETGFPCRWEGWSHEGIAATRANGVARSALDAREGQ